MYREKKVVFVAVMNGAEEIAALIKRDV